MMYRPKNSRYVMSLSMNMSLTLNAYHEWPHTKVIVDVAKLKVHEEDDQEHEDEDAWHQDLGDVHTGCADVTIREDVRCQCE